MRKFWNKLVALLYKVPFDKYLHFIAGLIIAAFFALAFGWKWGALLAAIVAGIGKEVFDYFTTKQTDWKDAAATVIGGLVIFIFALL